MSRKRRRILWSKVLAWIGCLVALAALFYICFRTSTFSITDYDLVGIPDGNKTEIKNGLEEIAHNTFYKVLPSNRIFSYRGLKIKSLITKILPNTESVSIIPVGLHTLRITVTEYNPLFKIDNKHAVTKDGIIYEELKDISSLPTIEIASSTTKTINNDGVVATVLNGDPKALLSKISDFIEKINSVIFIVTKVKVNEYGDITFFDERGVSEVIISNDSDSKKVWSNIVSAIDTDPLKSKLNSNKDDLVYLDTRFGNKVFYKFRNGVIIQNHVATTTATTTISH